MFDRTSFRGTRRFALGVGALSVCLLGGCVVAPPEPYVVGAPVAYSPVYAAPVYAPAPYYGYGWPAVSLGFYGSFGHGGWGGGHRGGWGHGGGRGHRGWR